MHGKNKIFLLIAVLLALSVPGCAKKEAEKPKETKPQESADTSNTVNQKVLSFNLEGLSNKGTKKWDVTGESAEAVSESEVKLDNIVARAYGNEAQATITADKGVYDKTKNNVRLQQNVKAVIDNTESFGSDFMGISVEGDTNAKKKGSAGNPKKTSTTITCDGEVQFDYEKNQAYFTKNVKVVSSDGSIDADKITVNLDPDTKKVKDIVAEGNVKISRGENVSYSDKATYIESEKKVVLTGKPKLVIYHEGENIKTDFLTKGK